MPTIESLPDGSKRVTLTRPIVTHGGDVRAIILREPTYSDFFDLGDPTAWIYMDGARLPQVDQSVVRRYVERLADVDAVALEQIKSLADAMALQRVIHDFFLQASGSISISSPTP